MLSLSLAVQRERALAAPAPKAPKSQGGASKEPASAPFPDSAVEARSAASVILHTPVPMLRQPGIERDGLLPLRYDRLIVMVDTPTREMSHARPKLISSSDPLVAQDLSIFGARTYARTRADLLGSAAGATVIHELERSGCEKVLYMNFDRPNLMIFDHASGSSDPGTRPAYLGAPSPVPGRYVEKKIANPVNRHAFSWNPALFGITADDTRTSPTAIFATLAAAFMRHLKQPPSIREAELKARSAKPAKHISRLRFAEGASDRAIRFAVTNPVAESLGEEAALTPHTDFFVDQAVVVDAMNHAYQDPHFLVSRSRLQAFTELRHRLDEASDRLNIYDCLTPLLQIKRTDLPSDLREDLEDLVNRNAALRSTQARRANVLEPLLRPNDQPLSLDESRAIGALVRDRIRLASLRIERMREECGRSMQSVLAHYDDLTIAPPMSADACKPQVENIERRVVDLEIICDAHVLPRATRVTVESSA